MNFDFVFCVFFSPTSIVHANVLFPGTWQFGRLYGTKRNTLICFVTFAIAFSPFSHLAVANSNAFSKELFQSTSCARTDQRLSNRYFFVSSAIFQRIERTHRIASSETFCKLCLCLTNFILCSVMCNHNRFFILQKWLCISFEYRSQFCHLKTKFQWD